MLKTTWLRYSISVTLSIPMIQYYPFDTQSKHSYMSLCYFKVLNQSTSNYKCLVLCVRVCKHMQTFQLPIPYYCYFRLVSVSDTDKFSGSTVIIHSCNFLTFFKAQIKSLMQAEWPSRPPCSCHHGDLREIGLPFCLPLPNNRDLWRENLWIFSKFHSWFPHWKTNRIWEQLNKLSFGKS